jgi:3-phosphoshikimate 1-carboxyvinyltransferase
MIRVAAWPRRLEGTIRLPGSKYIANRAFLMAALAQGTSRIENAPDNRDLERTRAFASFLGAGLQPEGDFWQVQGVGGRPVWETPRVFFCGESGTLARWTLALSALSLEPIRLEGASRLQERPMAELVSVLVALGAQVEPATARGLPLSVSGPVRGGRVTLSGQVSSQFGSALLTLAPLLPEGLTIDFASSPVSRSYLDLTLETMRRFGVEGGRDSEWHFEVPGGQDYRATRIRIAPDPVLAGYFMALPAVLGGSIHLPGLVPDGSGEGRLIELLGRMGLPVRVHTDGLTVLAPDGPLRALGTVDLSDAPDGVPTLAVLTALVGEGTSRLTGIGHLRFKESDRLLDLAGEMVAAGLSVQVEGEDLVIAGGGRLRPVVMDAHGDHRLAMSFALLAMACPGLAIRGEESVGKSFPDFWRALGQLGISWTPSSE